MHIISSLCAVLKLPWLVGFELCLAKSCCRALYYNVCTCIGPVIQFDDKRLNDRNYIFWNVHGVLNNYSKTSVSFGSTFQVFHAVFLPTKLDTVSQPVSA